MLRRCYIKQHKSAIFVTLFFGVIYCLISLINHYNFRTYAWDLGIYNQTIYDYAHFSINQNTVLQPSTNNILSDHFSLIHFLISPLYWIFKSYTLLVVQIVAILFGGVGVYKCIKEKSKNEKFSVLAMVHFFSLWGIYSALGFDYHDNVVGAMFVPWFIYLLIKEKYLYAFFSFLLLLISKENMILWGIFLALGMLMIHYKNSKQRFFLIGLTIFSTLFFLLVMKLIMPALADEGKEYVHFRYSILGESFGEAIVNLFKHPLKYLEAFFTNFLDNTEAKGIKKEFFFVFLISGGFVMLRKPKYLIILLPILGQKLLSDDYMKWSLNYQYSIEFAPILSIALFEYLSEHIKKHLLKWGLLAALIAGGITIIKIEDRLPSWSSSINMKFYSKKHYNIDYNRSNVQEAINIIPVNAEVSAEANIVSHLASRKIIYQFPKIDNAKYIILMPNDGYNYPLPKEELDKMIADLILSKKWNILKKNEDVILLKKIQKD